MKQLWEKHLFPTGLRGIPLSPLQLYTSISAPLMDVSVWQVLIYLAPTVAHSNEAVRAECLPRVQENIIFHIISEQ